MQFSQIYSHLKLVRTSILRNISCNSKHIVCTVHMYKEVGQMITLRITQTGTVRQKGTQNAGFRHAVKVTKGSLSYKSGTKIKQWLSKTQYRGWVKTGTGRKGNSGDSIEKH